MRSMKIIKSCYLDANLLVSLGNKNSIFHHHSQAILKKLITQKIEIVLSPLTLDEYEYTTVKSSNDPKGVTFRKLKVRLRKLFKISNFRLVNPPLECKKHLRVITLMANHNLKPRDAYHLFIMLANKVKFLATFDSDFDEVFKKGQIKKFE